jgi:hypothetical protein
MPRHDKVKINRANGQIGGKNRGITFLLTVLIYFGPFNISKLIFYLMTVVTTILVA